jgi:hypothetical protein
MMQDDDDDVANDKDDEKDNRAFAASAEWAAEAAADAHKPYVLAVGVCIRNERRFMGEFVRHYLAQGADHVYIVDNGSTDGGVEGLPECADPATVSVIRDARELRLLSDNAGGAIGHWRLLTENLLARLQLNARWAAVVDADEFMFGKNGHTLRSYVLSLPPAVGRVYVFWNILSPRRETVEEEVSSSGRTRSGADLDADLDDQLPVLGRHRRRPNYDRMWAVGGALGEDARHANNFGKSLFRPARARLPEGLWLHKVAVPGGPPGSRAVTNYDEHSDEASVDGGAHACFDNRPWVARSEADYRRVNVTLHHYALRSRSDVAKKAAQLPVMAGKARFLNGLFEMLRCADDGAFVDDDALPCGGAAGTADTNTSATTTATQGRRRCCCPSPPAATDKKGHKSLSK